MEMEVLTNICRICEKQSTFMDLSHPDHHSYVVKFLSCANVTFQINDALPKHLCRLCTSKLEHSYRFKQKCEETQAKLQKLTHKIYVKDELNLIEKIDNENIDQISVEQLLVKSEENLDFLNYHSDLSIQSCAVVKESQSRKNGDGRKIGKGKFICDVCGRRSLSKKGMERHMCIKHKMATNLCECPYCGDFFTGQVYSSHLSKHEKPYKCELCGLAFPYNGNLTRHISDVHVKLKKFQCHLCESTFVRKSTLDQHIGSVHFKEYKYNCDKCDKKYSTKHVLDKHTLKYHLSPEETESIKLKLFQCKICDKIHKSEADLKWHKSRKLCRMPTKNNDKDSQLNVCQWCGKMFNGYRKYYKHMLIHKNKSYKCDICNKLLSTSSTLSAHKRTHTGEKPHKCTECNMNFAQRPNLLTHMKTHTGEKPYECTFCGKTFAIKQNCTIHMRLHTGEKPHHCLQCTESFIDSNGLLRHRRKYHPE